MNWARIAGHWKQLKGIARQRLNRMTGDHTGIRVADDVTKEAREKQLAEWLVREHKADPIHK